MKHRFLILSRHFPPSFRSGGPARSLEAMIMHFPSPEMVSIVTRSQDLGGEPLPVSHDAWTSYQGAQTYYASSAVRALIQTIRSRSVEPHFVYLNSLFSPAFALFPLLLAKFKWWTPATIVVAPRGELAPGALSLKTWKKRLTLHALRRLHLTHQVLWHATSQREAEDIANEFPNAATVISKNKTSLPSAPQPVRPPGDNHTVAFIGRISPVKGLHILLSSLVDFPYPLQLHVYGGARNDETSYMAECHRIIAQIPDHVHIRIYGPTDRERVLKLLPSYDLLALPTAGENFGHAIVEALAAGCPVMLPPTTPWTEAARRTGTLVPDRSPASWTTSLIEHFNQSPDQIHARKRLAARVYAEHVEREQSAPNFLSLLESYSN